MKNGVLKQISQYGIPVCAILACYSMMLRAEEAPAEAQKWDFPPEIEATQITSSHQTLKLHLAGVFLDHRYFAHDKDGKEISPTKKSLFLLYADDTNSRYFYWHATQAEMNTPLKRQALIEVPPKNVAEYISLDKAFMNIGGNLVPFTNLPTEMWLSGALEAEENGVFKAHGADQKTEVAALSFPDEDSFLKGRTVDNLFLNNRSLSPELTPKEPAPAPNGATGTAEGAPTTASTSGPTTQQVATTQATTRPAPLDPRDEASVARTQQKLNISRDDALKEQPTVAGTLFFVDELFRHRTGGQGVCTYQGPGYELVCNYSEGWYNQNNEKDKNGQLVHHPIPKSVKDYLETAKKQQQ